MALVPAARRLRAGVVVAVAVLVAATGFGAPLGAQTSEPDRRPVTFADIAAIDELTDDHARIFRLYWASFDREPDPVGALFWIDRFDRCQTLHHIAAHFTRSDEFVGTYGSLTDAEFVDVIYQNVLDRQAEPGGRAYWLDQIRRGRMTRTDVMLHFSYSREFVDRTPLPSDGVPGRGCQPPEEAAQQTSRTFGLQAWQPLARIGPVTIVLPSTAVERVGFHESSHDGSQSMQTLDVLPPVMVLDTRNRGTGPQTAADIVVHPSVEVRSPVTGTVLRAGGYILYCQYRDDFVVIEPDARPGWEVKIFHIDGVQVRSGDRVEAGVTVLAPKATLLPFRSQIDKHTAEPSWPHVHVEVVDPSIPDRPSGGC